MLASCSVMRQRVWTLAILSALTLFFPAPSSFGSEPAFAEADEMLRGPGGQWQRWTRAPELVVLTAVMEYHAGPGVEYVATAEALTRTEVDELIADLTRALADLTGDALAFAAIHTEFVSPGAQIQIARPGQIVVGRYRGVRTLLNDVGMGGRTSRKDGTITSGAIVLDSEYDRTNKSRRLVRTHELGHALGFNHVVSRPSIMNPRVGSGLTDYDRASASRAFRNIQN